MMKRLILIFTVIIPYFGFSQRDGSKIMDFSNIDYRLLDSLIIVEVNKVRDSLGHFHMNYSSVVSDNITKPRCNIQHREQHVYHPEGRMELYSDKVESSIVKESLTKYGFKNGKDFVDGFEICLFKSRYYKLLTYGDYAKSIVDLWETSPDHCMVIRDAWGDPSDSRFEFIIMSGVSTKYGMWGGRNGFYAVLNLTVVYR
jgi:hypothetical protein